MALAPRSVSPAEPELLGATAVPRRGPNGTDSEATSEIDEGVGNHLFTVESASTASRSSFGQWEEARRQELMDQGYSAAQIDAIFVRQHRQEVMAEVCRHWFLLFGISSFILGMLTIVMLVWLCFVWSKAYLRGFEACDTALTVWGYVLYSAMILNFAKSTSCGQRAIGAMCWWDPDPAFPGRAPLRVKILNLMLPMFMFSWNAIGIHWARLSKAPQVEMLVCQEEAQGVIDAIMAFAIVNIALTVFMFLNIMGLAYFFRVLLRMGLVQSAKAAPEGSLERSTEQVTAQQALEAECESCPICLEEFREDDTSDILRTVQCHHYFHRPCLKDWLHVNRDCPLCREDLAKPPPTEAKEELRSEVFEEPPVLPV